MSAPPPAPTSANVVSPASDVRSVRAVTEKEIRSLYERFRRLDKTFSGVISTHDFELIPVLVPSSSRARIRHS